MTRSKYLIIISFLFLAFIALSIAVLDNRLIHLDLFITTNLQNLIPRKVDTFFSIFSILGTFEITTLIFVLLLIAVRKINWLWGVIFYGLGNGIEVLGKLFIKHSSPPSIFFRYNLNFVFPSAYIQTAYSYPSGHIFRTSFIVLILGIIVFNSERISISKKIVLGFLLLIYLSIMMVSRIYLGEHWTSDVVAGLLLGLEFGLIFYLISFFPKRKFK